MAEFPDPIWQRILKAHELVLKLDPMVRAVAFERIMDAYEGEEGTARLDNPGASDHALGKGSGGVQREDNVAKDVFFAAYDHKRPSENVFLIAAWLILHAGMKVVAKADVDRLAGEVGLVVPERPDMTLRNARSDGKSLFQSTDSGFRPTVHGQIYLRDTYGEKRTKPALAD